MEVAIMKHDASLVRKLLSEDMAGSIYTGEFRPARGGTIDVTDKATGEFLFKSANRFGVFAVLVDAMKPW